MKDMLQNLATGEIMNLLLKDRKGASRRLDGNDGLLSLVICGTATVEKLLDRLQESRSMSERNRILQALTRIGSPAVDPITKRLDKNAPWYFTRNLLLLLGRIGNKQHLGILAEWMGHSDYRVQREAVKSIQAIGGDAAAPVLFSHLESTDGRLKGYIVSVIGAQRYRDAIPRLLEMLAFLPLAGNRAEGDEIREKICEALGRMKAEESVSELERIVGTRKGIFSRKESGNVRSAAAKALAKIESSCC